MKFAPLFLVLLCLQLLCLCNGAPLNENLKLIPSPLERVKYRFTEQEYHFMVKEILSLPKDYKNEHCTSFWKYLAEKFIEQRQLKTPGFPHDRSSKSIRLYLKTRALKNAELMAALPESFRQQFNDPNYRRKEDTTSEGASSSSKDQSTSQTLQIDFQMPIEGQDESDLASWIEELENAPWELDFSKLE